MWQVRRISKGIACVLAALAVVAAVEPALDLWSTLSVYVDPKTSFGYPSGPERLRRTAGAALVPTASLAFAALLWLVADMHEATLGRSRAVRANASDAAIPPEPGRHGSGKS
jgi:hypothetical protein